MTLIVQLAPAARLAPQLFVCAKSPLVLIELIDAALVPGFCSVTAWAALVVPTVWPAKPRLPGVTVSAPPVGGAAGYTSSSDTCPAGQPVLAVKFRRT